MPASALHPDLPESIEPLLERIAEQVHVAWMESRRREGWTYGAERNDLAKTHPGMVPYAELAESEKEYDRRTARAAIRAILDRGYRIVGPDLDSAG